MYVYTHLYIYIYIYIYVYTHILLVLCDRGKLRQAIYAPATIRGVVPSQGRGADHRDV